MVKDRRDVGGPGGGAAQSGLDAAQVQALLVSRSARESRRELGGIPRAIPSHRVLIACRMSGEGRRNFADPSSESVGLIGNGED